MATATNHTARPPPAAAAPAPENVAGRMDDASRQQFDHQQLPRLLKLLGTPLGIDY